MKPSFICHPDFEWQAPIPIFYKQKRGKPRKEEDERFLNRHILFRRSFFFAGTGRAVLRITADDYYKLYINGAFVTQGPAAGYPQAYYYNELDVTAFLREGENLIAVHTYYQGLINRVWVSGDRRQMLWCELSVDGVPCLCTDTSWKCHDHTAYTACGKVGYDTAFCERYDSSAPECRFFAPDFDDSAWGQAALYQGADYTLQPQPTRQLVLYPVAPVTSEAIEGGFRLDFGREMVGYLTATAKGRAGDCLLLRYGEELNEDGSVRYKTRCNCKYEEQWVLSGGKDNLNQFDYKAFRYAEVLCPDGVELGEVGMLVRHYPYEQCARYRGGSAELQSILSLCADTVKYGTQENYVDCPTREKGQYLGDVSIAARAQAVLTGDVTMMKKAIRDFCTSTFICPGMMAVSCGGLMQEIADYSLQFPAQVLFVYAMEGDKDFLREVLPVLEGMYRYFLDYAREDGLLCGLEEKWNLVDWPENLRDGYVFPEVSLPHNVLNAFWCGFLAALDEIYGVLEKAPTGMTARVKKSFLNCFYDPERGEFCDDPAHTHAALHSNVLPLLFEIGTEDAARRARLVDKIRRKRLSSVGVYMAYFALAALCKHGERALAEELILDPACWLNMLREGATTTFEAWGKEQKWNTSLFHPWAVAPAIVLAENARIY